jgi:hypothetical protein
VKSVKVQLLNVMFAWDATQLEVAERPCSPEKAQPDFVAFVSDSLSRAVHASEERKRGTCRESKNGADWMGIDGGWKNRSMEEWRRAKDV